VPNVIGTTDTGRRSLLPTMSTSAPDAGDDARRIDVREIDGEPFGEIVTALDGLDPGETLVLAAGFEPVPLYDVLERRGFVHETTRVDDGEWRVEIGHERV